MTDHLGTETKRLLALARDAASPSKSDRQSTRSSIAKRLAAAGAAGATAATLAGHAGGTASHAVAGTGLLKTVLGAHIWISVAVGGTLALGLLSITQSLTPQRSSSTPAGSGVVRTRMQAAGAPVGRAPMASVSAAKEEDLPPTPAAPRPTMDTAPPDLERETRALDEVQPRLRDGHGEEAIELLAVQEREFGGGALVEERAAAQVFALCQSGRSTAARAAAFRFLKRWPESPLSRRVRATCRD